MSTAYDVILSWFTGKAESNAAHALGLLAKSLEQGSWLPKASRYVAAKLSKANVASKFVQANRMNLESINSDRSMTNDGGWQVGHCMYFGQFQRIQAINWSAVESGCQNDDQRKALAYGKKYAADFAGVAAAIERLDSTRPIPTFTSLGVSPTLTATLKSLGIDASIETLRVCPIEWVQVEKVDPKTGKKSYYKVGHMKWPEGTRHGLSRYNWSRHDNEQCQACGHAIRNPFNWVPLVVDNAKGPLSLWVGRDCAFSLFGVDVKGEVELEEGSRVKTVVA